MTTQALNVLDNVEQDIEALAVPTPTAADQTQPSSWAAGQASPTTVLTVIATALNILYTISDGMGTTMSNASSKLAALLQDTATALAKFSDELGLGSDVGTALQQAIALLPVGGNAAQLLNLILQEIQQNDPDVQSLVDAVQADVKQTQIDLYKMAQELHAIGKALTPGA